MAIRSLFPLRGTASPGMIPLSAKIVLGQGGAIASQPGAKAAGFSLAKTANKTGRYTVTLFKNFKRLCGAHCDVIGADDAAFDPTKGIQSKWRDNDIDGGAADGTIELQLVRPDTYADAEAPDAAELLVTFFVSET